MDRSGGRRRDVRVLTPCRDALAPPHLDGAAGGARGKAVKGAVKTAGRPGAHTLRFKGRIGGKTLRPGRYRLTITARAMVGGGTAQATMAFRIVR
jgi:hypothetical protein